MRAARGGEILVVDSDSAFLQTLIPCLEQNGHEVAICGSGVEARARLERISTDVVLCAELLPDCHGDELCRWVKENPEYPDLQRVSFGLLSTRREQSNSYEPVDYEEALPAASRKGLLGALFGGSRPAKEGEPAAPSPIPPQAATGPTRRSSTCPTDDIILKSTPLVELAWRVQSLLRLRRYLDEISNAVSALMAVAEGIEEQDRRARGHCKRLSLMAMELGSIMGCDEWQLTSLERGAYLHDIGKVSIPGALFSKSDALTPREMEIIQGHCVSGEKLCMTVAALKPVLPIIRHHHERANGTGYPDGLRGEDIPIMAQILSIPDIYDALRMWRPYRQPMTEGQAISVMRQEVNQGFWNRHIFEAFVTGVLPGLDERLDMYHVLWPPTV